MRRDTLQLLKELDAPLYRWPGGNFVSGYDWRDGIGDRDRRPPRKNPAWRGIEHNDFARIVTEAAGEVFPADPPLFLARTPHGYHDVERIRGDLEAARFSQIEIETLEERSRASSPRDPAVAYCQGTPLRNEIEQRDAGRLEEVTARAAAV